MLAERHNIQVSAETVRQLMIAQGLWRAKQQRVKPLHPCDLQAPCDLQSCDLQAPCDLQARVIFKPRVIFNPISTF